MILDARQTFTLTHPGRPAEALAFVRDPGLALSQVRFLRHLQADAQAVSGELIVTIPILGEVDLPFRSALSVTPLGAALTPQSLSGERAWVEVRGDAQVLNGHELHFDFQFRAHLATPDAEGWGGAAFEKMVRAAAGRTLDRVAHDLPAAVALALAST